ncbi:L-seryl-tRNA(Sec) selenium transferase [Oscillochloris sp. ZM17-4]|uniref:L-seryl-tRNA(Sec) selenium transferase n=1 Tax=Oscillochloris sp. ZM17-4 TaxID=2866714 RepID=UPI001C72F3FC|nr:L-seryl-tRNA(Sec) selenium transferase [Oscillochloris sp. ZM17-4]MBX0331194.1 L-seryl-tRNA(Sec) selenium transferase [Oscillochloris sp. ZM17-4]
MITPRDIPSVDRLMTAMRAQIADAPHALLRDVARAEITALREEVQRGAAPPDADLLDLLVGRAAARLARDLTPSLLPVINASGVIIQTNLGRAPLSAGALEAMARVGAGYSNLEYDLEAGERGSRSVHLESLLRRLSGAEAALAVNNNAAAIYLALSALAVGREVIVSRGQAVEIGGGFRIPDVLRQSGAELREVGTTNRTYVGDYAAAISERTALLMRIHTSNFRLMGFVHETGLAEMAELGRARGVPVLDDLGSGTLLATSPYGLTAEPTVQESVAAGADLVTFSGDKLLGGPQAGLIVGRRDLVERLRRHPLARALRVDKTTIAGLEATLLSYLRGRAAEEIPIWRMIAAPLEGLRARAEAMAARLAMGGAAATVTGCASAVGGGSLPGEILPSAGVAISPGGDALSRRLRTGAPAVVGRLSEGQLIFDLRTVLPEQEAALEGAILAAL